jgi:hypothetical protein
MHSRWIALRALVVVAVIVAGTLYFSQQEPVRGIDLDASRLIASDRLPDTLEACTWDVAAPERPSLQRGQGAAGDGRSDDRRADAAADNPRSLRRLRRHSGRPGAERSRPDG